MKPDENREPPMDSSALLKFILENFSKRFDEEMKWIDDIEKKAASLIAVNGVVLALSAPLFLNIFSLFREIFENMVCLGFLVRFILLLIIVTYILQLCLFGRSIYLAYNAYQIESYDVPDIKYLIDEYNEPKSSETKILEGFVSDLNGSLESLDEKRSKKASAIKKSQLCFMCGAFVLIVVMILLAILLLIQYPF